mgnify:CR=1 FL=1
MYVCNDIVYEIKDTDLWNNFCWHLAEVDMLQQQVCASGRMM